MNDIVFCAVLMASMASANAESWPVDGTVKAPCAVAVSLKSPLHFYATRGTSDVLATPKARRYHTPSASG